MLFLVLLAGVAGWSAISGTAASDVKLLPCPMQAAAGIPCPGCGMTRACVAFAQGDLGQAWSFHPFAFFLIPLSLLVAFWPVRTRETWGGLPSRVRTVIGSLAVATCVGLWVSRLMA